MPVGGRSVGERGSAVHPAEAGRSLLVTAAVIRRGRRILIARRAGADSLAGLWEFPGGKLKLGESPESCLVREISEELGLEVAVVRALGFNEHRYPERTVRLLFYEVESRSGRVKLSAHDRFAWVSPVMMNAYVFAPADRPMVDQIARNGGVVPLPVGSGRPVTRRKGRTGSGVRRRES
jgi:8-oxo-dGTP diphosphatase